MFLGHLLHVKNEEGIRVPADCSFSYCSVSHYPDGDSGQQDKRASKNVFKGFGLAVTT